MQNFPTYDGFLQIEKRYSAYHQCMVDYMIITLKKPAAKPQYIMNSDPQKVDEAIKDH